MGNVSEWVSNWKGNSIYVGGSYKDEKGAFNITFDYPKETEIDKNKSYIVYCRSGARSAKASYYLSQNGFKNVYNLEGGISGYSGEIIK